MAASICEIRGGSLISVSEHPPPPPGRVGQRKYCKMGRKEGAVTLQQRACFDGSEFLRGLKDQCGCISGCLIGGQRTESCWHNDLIWTRAGMWSSANTHESAQFALFWCLFVCFLLCIMHTDVSLDRFEWHNLILVPYTHASSVIYAWQEARSLSLLPIFVVPAGRNSFSNT